MIFNDKPMDWKVPIGTAIAAVLFAGAERAIGQTAVRLAYLALLTTVFVRVDPSVPSPRSRHSSGSTRGDPVSTAEKIAMGIVGIGMATTLVLPGRQTVPIIDAIRNLFTGSLATAMASTKR
ncbi:hypothetical protein E4K10_49915 [Streptomyces sp. T1317-0309]|nr:hypothetical protein E4K10_49915 [Streptomyces sp. T1317-0309]